MIEALVICLLFMINFDVINDIPTTNKTIFLFANLDVPLSDDGAILDDSKIKKALPTINYLVKTGARVVIATHLGHPAREFDTRYSTKAIAGYLDKRMSCDVTFCRECVGEQSRREIFRAEYGSIVVLENLLFYPEELNCDLNFAKQLADGMNIFVNDNFECCRKSYASNLGVPLFVRATAGLVLTEEIKKLDVFLNPANQFTTAIIGGNQTAKKMDLINSLVDRVKCLFLAGEVANTFLSASGKNVGISLCETGMEIQVEKVINKAKKNGCLVLLPSDVRVVKQSFENSDEIINKSVDDIEEDDLIVDVGDQYLKDVYDILDLSRCVFWDGALGATEFKQYRFSTMALCEKIATCSKKKRIFSIVNGSDVVDLLKNAKLYENISFIPSSFTSAKQYIGGKVLPGIEILRRLSKQLA